MNWEYKENKEFREIGNIGKYGKIGNKGIQETKQLLKRKFFFSSMPILESDEMAAL